MSGKSVTENYSLYKETQWYKEEEMNIYKLKKLKYLIKHCYANVPFYSNFMKNQGIMPKDIVSLEQLKLFPIITKEIIQDNYSSFIPININKIKGVKITQTGGTTGNTLIKRNDANTRSSIWASYKRYEDWMGYSKNDKTLIMMGGHLKNNHLKDKIISNFVSYLEKSVSLDIYNTSDKTIDKIITLLNNRNFNYIRSYPQFLFTIAKSLEQRGMNFNLKGISLTAEPVMHAHRQLFKDIFNSEVYDQYGCGEIGGIAYECNKHEGLHITEERVIIETNYNNELIITDLDNYSMPFIRYWNGDQVEISNDKCSCSRQSKLIKKIKGRIVDQIIGTNSQYLHPSYFWALFEDSNISTKRNLRKFQIVQFSRNNLLIRLESNPLSEEEKKFLITDIKNKIGDLTIEFSYNSKIENTNTGKYRAVINKIL